MMSFFDLANHLFNFVLPAIAMGVMMPLFSRTIWRKTAVKPSLQQQMLNMSVAGVFIDYIAIKNIAFFDFNAQTAHHR